VARSPMSAEIDDHAISTDETAHSRRRLLRPRVRLTLARSGGTTRSAAETSISLFGIEGYAGSTRALTKTLVARSAQGCRGASRSVAGADRSGSGQRRGAKSPVADTPSLTNALRRELSRGWRQMEAEVLGLWRS
jgi:hypothetical protein